MAIISPMPDDSQGENMFCVTSDDGIRVLVGPVSEQDAGRYLLLLNVIQDGIHAADYYLYAKKNERQSAFDGLEGWSAEAELLLHGLDNAHLEGRHVAVTQTMCLAGL